MPFITQTAAGLREELKVYGGDYATPTGRPSGTISMSATWQQRTGWPWSGWCAASSKRLRDLQYRYRQGTSVPEVIQAFEKVSGRTLPYWIVDRRPGDGAGVGGYDPSQPVLGWTAERSLRTWWPVRGSGSEPE